MSAVIEKPRAAKIGKKSPAPAKPLIPAHEVEFLKGRDWAIRCLEEAQWFQDAQSEEPNRLRWIRKGKQQDNFVLGWIADAVGPGALENQALRGFCAVLSDYISNPSGTMFPHAYKIPYAEFHGGEIGQDGTKPTPPEMEEDDDPPQAPAPATKSLITAETPITEAGVAAENLALWCSHDIETLADEVTLLGEEATVEGQTRMGALLRCYGTRIAELNGAIMSFLSGDSVMTMRDLQRAHYRGAKFFQPQEVDRD